MRFRSARWLLLLSLTAALPGPLRAAEPARLLRLADLPETFETRIPAVLEERLADVERVAAALPAMDRKRAYLITLPLQSYLEDVVLPSNRPAAIQPRAIAWVIGREAARGASQKEISRLLVGYYQKDLFRSIDTRSPDPPTAAAGSGDRP